MTEQVLARRSIGGRWVLVGALLAALLLLGVYDVAVLTVLTKWWQRMLAAVGLRQQVEALQQNISGSVVKRPLPVVATYAVGYLSICLLLLRLLLPAAAQWRLVLRLYAGTLAVYVALVVLGKLAGDAQWAYRLSRQLLDFVVSPLPVAGLYVLLRSGFGARAAA
ncbi:hypothetical protein JAO73_16395 [Hymenobacter sp. BT523]|uniref:XrtX-associated membrane protein n=1 Tax=Hymenobacter sp. BT523 TaxID=2795725 RepID=UPI0018EBD2A7|nr:hypothetical protein [Hymenobacter sp. BT523]MBJ6110606.1 hypothetical protein [Hymenobacter sp. BT523]